LRIDDSGASTADAIADASEWVYFYCGTRYSDAALLTSNWIKYRTRDIAVLFLCARRLNAIPKAAQALYDAAIAALEKVQAGTLNIAGVPLRKSAGPVISQPRVQLWPTPHTVIERNRSTGQPAGYTPRDDPYEPPYPGN
jgi:phage gp36-like protein